MKTITIPWPDWTIVREIGRGGFGTVYEISRKDQYGSEEKAALKVINIPHEAEVINQYRMDGYDDASISARLKEDYPEDQSGVLPAEPDEGSSQYCPGRR